MSLTWSDAARIGEELFDRNPDLDPLTLRFTDLRDMILALDDFTGEAAESSEGALEAIQMAWLEEYRDA